MQNFIIISKYFSSYEFLKICIYLEKTGSGEFILIIIHFLLNLLTRNIIRLPFFVAWPGPLKKLPLTCRPGLARWKSHLSFADPASPVRKILSHSPGRVRASGQARARVDL